MNHAKFKLSRAIDYLRQLNILPQQASSASQKTFEQEFDREIMQSEQLRSTALAIAASIGALSFVVPWLVFPMEYQRIFAGRLPITWVIAFFGVVIIDQLVVRFTIARAIKTKRKIPHRFRFISAFLETSFPTLGIFILAQIYEPVYMLSSPATFTYFLFIILASLRLDFGLCIFTGLVAAIEYIAISFYCIHVSSQHNTEGIEFFLLSFLYIQKSIILLMAGVLTGLVTTQIKQRVMNSFKSIEEKNRIVQVFGQHVSPIVVNKLLHQKADAASEIRYVCIMFLDIRNFTRFSESRKPEEVVLYLNTLFDFMIDIVNCHHGIVNKFLGDGFMAIFGAPLSNGNDSLHAVNASIAIINRVQQEIALGNIPETRIGIGLHTGEAVTGSVGSALRKEYTVIGDVVNLASRIEQLNKQFNSQILISEAVFNAVYPEIKSAQEIGDVQVRGHESTIRLYQLA